MIQQTTRRSLPWPKARRFLNPIQHAKWLFGFLGSWAGTRGYSRLLAALPFLCVLVALGVWYLSPKPKLARHYERSRDVAAREQNSELARLTTKRLIQMQPDKPAYRYVLAKDYLAEGDLVEAVRILHALAPIESENVFAKADLKLVELATDTTNTYTESTAGTIRRLTRVLQQEPDNLQAHRLLSAEYLKNDQPRMAEPHLERVCADSPKLMLELARLKLRNGNKEQALQVTRRAEQIVSDQVRRGDNRSATLITQARLLRVLGKGTEAKQILSEGYKREPDDFRRPLAEHYKSVAQQRLALSPFYRKQAVALLTNGLAVDPGNSEIVGLVTQLGVDLEDLPGPVVKQLNRHWNESSGKPSADAKTLSVASRLAQSQGDFETAIRLMTRASKANSAYRDALVHMLTAAGRDAQALELAEQLASNYRTKLASDPSDGVTRIRLARLLTSIDRFEESERVLRSGTAQDPAVQRELVALIRRRIESGSLSVAQKQQLAHEGLAISPMDSVLLTEVARHAATGESSDQSSRDFVLDLVSSGKLSAAVAYAAMGTAALDCENYDQAEQDLRQSAKLERMNPLAWNNLALVLIRKSKPQPKLAIQAIEFALKLLPDHETLLATYGEALIAAGRWADATAALEKALQLGKERKPEIHEQLASAYKSLGNTELAERHRGLADALRADETP